MPSDTALTLVNKVLRITGDYEPVATVVGSPASIAERIIDFLNITLQDIVRKIEYRELIEEYISTADGINSVWVAAGGVGTKPKAILSCQVGNTPMLEEVSLERLSSLRNSNAYFGVPAVFTRATGALGELAVDIYPTPPTGNQVTVIGSKEPTLFTVSDTSATEIEANDLLVLGAVAHSDAFSGMDRGYMQLYEAAKARAWHNIYEHQQFRIETEDYH